MIRQHLRRDAEIGREESRAQLGNKLLACIAFVAVPHPTKIAGKTLRVFRPVGDLVRQVAAWLSASLKVSKGGICT